MTFLSPIVEWSLNLWKGHSTILNYPQKDHQQNCQQLCFFVPTHFPEPKPCTFRSLWRVSHDLKNWGNPPLGWPEFVGFFRVICDEMSPWKLTWLAGTPLFFTGDTVIHIQMVAFPLSCSSLWVYSVKVNTAPLLLVGPVCMNNLQRMSLYTPKH